MLLDIMLDDRFICQLNYKKHGFPVEVDGKIYESYELSDLKEFIEQQKPSLIGKNYRIEFSKEKAYNHNFM